MQERWVGKNIDIDLLGQAIDAFLISKGLKTSKDTISGGCVISGSNEISSKGGVNVRILGESDDLIIEFLACDDIRRSFRLGLLTSFLGGGSVLLKSLNSQRAIEKLEEEFWIFAEDAIQHLAQSASRSKAP